jgi:hypothetical protein
MPGRTKRINCHSCESIDLAPKSALCTTCDNARRRQNRLDNSEREKRKNAEWYQNNKDHCREYKRNFIPYFPVTNPYSHLIEVSVYYSRPILK